MTSKVSAMIFAAGLGTRLYPLTADKPKALVEINGKTLLQIAIEKITAEGIRHIVVNVHHFSDLMKNYIATHSFDADVMISDESDELLDTAGGLKQAEPLLRDAEHILLYNVDVLSNINLQKLMDSHIRNNALATLAVRERNTRRYFIFDEDSMQLCGWQNMKTGEKKMARMASHEKLLAFSGIHVVNREIMNHIPPHQKMSMTPLYLQLAQNQSIRGYMHQDDSWCDVGKYEDWENKIWEK